MRRRVKPNPVGYLEPFVPPEGDLETRWDAWLEWERQMSAYESANPEQAEACSDARWRSEIPDAPFDPSMI